MRLAKLQMRSGEALYVNPMRVEFVRFFEGGVCMFFSNDNKETPLGGSLDEAIREINAAMNESVENSAATGESWEAWEGEVITRMRTTDGGLISIEIETGRGVIIQPKDVTYYVRTAEQALQRQAWRVPRTYGRLSSPEVNPD